MRDAETRSADGAHFAKAKAKALALRLSITGIMHHAPHTHNNGNDIYTTNDPNIVLHVGPASPPPAASRTGETDTAAIYTDKGRIVARMQVGRRNSNTPRAHQATLDSKLVGVARTARHPPPAPSDSSRPDASVVGSAP